MKDFLVNSETGERIKVTATQSTSWSFSYPRGNVWVENGKEVYADDWPLRRRILTRQFWDRWRL